MKVVRARRWAPSCGLGLTVALVVTLSLGATSARGGDVSAVALDPRRVTWQELHLEAHKLGIAAQVEIRLVGPAMPPRGTTWKQPGGSVDRPAAGTGAIWIESTTHLPGRTFLARERLDPVRPAAFEIVNTETGARNHRKTYTVADHGCTLDLLEPASLVELTFAPDRWTRHLGTVFTFPAALGHEPVVTGPAGLLYALSAGSVALPGDSMTINVLVQTQVERVTVAAEGIEPLELDYQQIEGGITTPVHAQLDALRLVARSAPIDATSPSAFRIFGLEGVVEILWDGTHRLPLEMSGQVKLLGHVSVRLASLTLR